LVPLRLFLLSCLGKRGFFLGGSVFLCPDSVGLELLLLDVIFVDALALLVLGFAVNFALVRQRVD